MSKKVNYKKSKKSKFFEIGKIKITKDALISIIIIAILIIIYALSPRYYLVTTGLYNQSTKENQQNVETAMGKENTEERFRLYFQWYNVIHELGHGLMYYNDGIDISVVEEEQLVNDFAVAYWKYYGEEEKVQELESIVNYAVEHIGDNYKNGIDYMELGKKNSNERSFYKSFFNFNDYGWFQFSSVKNSFVTNKSLENVLEEMGFNDFKIGNKKSLVYQNINEETSTKIINDAVKNFNDWGLEFPQVIHHFDKDPNNNYSRSVIKYLGFFEIPDFSYVFSS
ncbi:MAG: hypothetical protein PUA90_03105 [bacterium]|nr:hypothetical protein [bacterium]